MVDYGRRSAIIPSVLGELYLGPLRAFERRRAGDPITCVRHQVELGRVRLSGAGVVNLIEQRAVINDIAIAASANFAAVASIGVVIRVACEHLTLVMYGRELRLVDDHSVMLELGQVERVELFARR